MKRIGILFLILCLVSSCAGCGMNDGFTGNVKDLTKEITQQKIDASPTDIEECNELMTDFSIRLFQNSLEEGKNTLISPLSVLTALTMTANGAEGETLTQMEDTFGFPLEELNAYLHVYMDSLSKDNVLNLANAIWINDDGSIEVEQEFLQKNRDYLEAAIYAEEFSNGTVKNINRWVSDKTDGMIPDILDRIPDEAVMYLINALSFEAEWSEIYQKTQVHERDFILEDGTKKTVEMMYAEEYSYLENEFATGFVKPYKGGKYAFAALLPKEGMSIKELANSFDGVSIHHLLSEPKEVKVDTGLPKFETEYGLELSEIFKSMGMTLPFDEHGADFSKMGTTDTEKLFISRILHKTKISVAEKGTKAGAATAVEMCAESAMEEEVKRVILDRPFIYMLIDCETNTPFFIGTMMNPE